jgi:alpha-ketoglutarate-dependent taurine dioxygenase
MPLNMQPLSDKFGVAITNVDLSKDIDQNPFDEIVDVFVKKQVVVFRDQHIEPQHQVAFSRRFGPSGDAPRVGPRQRLDLTI